MSRTYLADSFEAAWGNVVLPWFRANRQRFLTANDIGVVVVPSLSFAQALRASLARERMAFAGLHIWVPSDVRRYLAGIFPDLPPAADRETLRLVLSAAAEETFAADQSLLSARSVASDPEPFLRSLDRLADAGWTHEELGDEQLVAIGGAYTRRLSDLGLATVQTRDFEIARRLRAGDFRGRPIGALLILGFSGAHWAAWPALESMCLLSGDTQVCLRSPRNDGPGLERAWIGNWESLTGPGETVTGDELVQDRPTFRYAEAIWARCELGKPARRSAVDFVVAEGTAAQARAAVRQTLAYLAKSSCERVGILVPGPGALAREIAAGLEASAVPFWDDLGTPRPGFFERAAWQSLLTFAGAPTCDSFAALLAAGLVPAALSGLTHADAVASLRGARTRLFLDDLTLVAGHLAAQTGERDARLGAFLLTLTPLPERGQFASLRESFTALLGNFALGSVCETIFGGDLASDPLRALPVSREAFLEWVKARARTLTRAQGSAGAHPYSRVVLTSYAQAEGLPWSHAVCTGLNEGSFPPPYSNAAFLGEETIFALNERVRKLNESSLVPIPGVGVRVAEGKGQIIGPLEERWASQQAFVGILEETRKRAAALISTRDESDPSATLRPGEYFLRLFEADHERCPSDTELARAAGAFRDTPSAPLPEDSVRLAFDRRRDRTTPFDEFSFSFRADDPRPVRLSASRWEAALSYPAEAWCNGALGLGLGHTSREMSWQQTIGEWTHAWLAAAGGGNGLVVSSRAAGHFSRAVAAASDATLATTVRLLAAGGRELPRWWLGAFEKARLLARQLATALDAVSVQDWPAFTCEVSIQGRTGVALADGRLHISLRMDLVFFDRAGSTIEDLLAAGARCWIIDFKSGKNKPLSSKRLDSGEGIQLALYALALADAGASDVLLTLLKPGADALNQLSLAEARSHHGLWAQLLRLQQSGRFGQLEAVRDEFRAGAEFPLATLGIPPEVLADKWRLTHPELP